MATTGKIVVVGDAGVGKTALCHLICRGEAIKSSSETIGANVEVKYHRDSFVEFWDVGGSERYASCRSMFFKDVQGIVLVHDLTNKVSYRNLRAWLKEISGAPSAPLTGVSKKQSLDDYDPESFADTNTIPTLVVGTKLDERPKAASERCSLATELGAVSFYVNSLDKSQALQIRSSVDAFLDKVQDYARGPSSRRRVQDVSHQSRW